MKKWSAVFAFLLLLCTVVGCSHTAVTVDMDASVDYIMTNIVFEDTLEELDRDVIAWRYGIADSVEARAFAGSGATAEEICIMQASDEAEAAELFAGLEQYLADTRSSFENYQPEEVKKIDQAFFGQYGNTVILVISADADAEAKLTEFFK